jgi:hypothetical protein
MSVEPKAADENKGNSSDDGDDDDEKEIIVKRVYDEDVDDEVLAGILIQHRPRARRCCIDNETHALLVNARENKFSITWSFHEAPALIQEITSAGGDEDYVSFVPSTVATPHCFSSKSFGSCSIIEHEILGDDKENFGSFIIGTH